MAGMYDVVYCTHIHLTSTTDVKKDITQSTAYIGRGALKRKDCAVKMGNGL